MEERELERQLGVAPYRLVAAEADVAVLVVVELDQLARQLRLGDAERCRREGARPLGDILEAEAGRLSR